MKIPIIFFFLALQIFKEYLYSYKNANAFLSRSQLNFYKVTFQLKCFKKHILEGIYTIERSYIDGLWDTKIVDNLPLIF